MVTMYFGAVKIMIPEELIETFITKNDICVMNEKSHTYLDSGKGTFSAIDLSLCHLSIFLDYDRSTIVQFTFYFGPLRSAIIF